MKKVKKTGVMLLGLAVVLGLVASGLVFTIIKSSHKEVDVLVANVDIQEGDPIRKDFFIKKGIHPSGSPSGAAVIEEVDFDGAIVSKGMLKGDILREEHIVKISDSTQELPMIATRVKAIGDDNLIAAEIPIQSINGILNGLKKGDKLTIVSVRENTKTEEIESKTILVNVEVVAVKGDSNDSAMDMAASGNSGVVAVALTQEEFKTLSLARDLGNIHVAIQPLGVEIDNSVIDNFKSTVSNSTEGVVQ